MPELPEVETIRLGLSRYLTGQFVSGVKSIWPKSIQGNPKRLIGRRIVSVGRRGKVLIIELDNDLTLLLHLKMTGQLVYETPKCRISGGHPTKSMSGHLPDKSTRAIFLFKDGSRLFFNDQRKFGWIKILPKSQVAADTLLAKMGAEPLEDGFKLTDFTATVKSKKAPIKAVILDQSTLAGIGNIYADESLHLAKIHPATPAYKLTSTEIKDLFEAIKSVLKAALGYGGTSFTNYVNAQGGRGNYLEYARVFKKTGFACPVCATPIVKIKVAGRGTHICPKCQKPPHI